MPQEGDKMPLGVRPGLSNFAIDYIDDVFVKTSGAFHSRGECWPYSKPAFFYYIKNKAASTTLFWTSSSSLHRSALPRRSGQWLRNMRHAFWQRALGKL